MSLHFLSFLYLPHDSLTPLKFLVPSSLFVLATNKYVWVTIKAQPHESVQYCWYVHDIRTEHLVLDNLGTLALGEANSSSPYSP